MKDKDFGASLESMLDGMQAVNNMRREDKRYRTIVLSSVASLALIISAGFAINRMSEPADSFADPYLAYAQVEESLNEIFSKISDTRELMETAGEKFELPKEIIDKAIR